MMKHHPNAIITAIITCGLLLTCIPLAETVNGAPFIDEVINSDSPLAIATDSPTPNSDFTILGSNSTISDIKQTTSEITFTVTGPTDTIGYVWCEIAENLIPHQDTSKNVKVLLDGNQINYMYTFDEGAWQLFFEYNHSTHQVAITLPPEKATILGIDQLTFVAGFVVICVVLGTAIVVWRKKQTPTQPQTASI